MKNRPLLFVRLSLVGIAISLCLAGPGHAQEKELSESTFEQLDLFGKVFETVRSKYVEDVDDTELIRSAIDGMLTALDPHSGYMPPKDFEKMQVQSKGEFGGVGIEITLENGILKVVSPIDGTPAAEAGIEAGDLIIFVDGKQTYGLTLNEIVENLRGPVGKEVVVTISREGEENPFDVTIIRDIIKIRAVRSRVVGNSAILRVSSFTEQTYDNLEEEIQKTTEEIGGIDAVEGYIIDLRNNPGGLLDQAIKVSDAFLEQGEIVSTRGRLADVASRHNAEPGDLAQGKPIVLLINRGSASASEIVAGALQDHRRAVLVGTKSFGKGSVQSILPLEDEGAVRLTISRYYTPSGRSIQALGIYPDVYVEPEPPVEQPEEEIDSRFTRFESDLRGALANEDVEDETSDDLESETARQQEMEVIRNQDNQLAYALDILHGLSVISND